MPAQSVSTTALFVPARHFHNRSEQREHSLNAALAEKGLGVDQWFRSLMCAEHTKNDPLPGCQKRFEQVKFTTPSPYISRNCRKTVPNFNCIVDELHMKHASFIPTVTCEFTGSCAGSSALQDAGVWLARGPPPQNLGRSLSEVLRPPAPPKRKTFGLILPDLPEVGKKEEISSSHSGGEERFFDEFRGGLTADSVKDERTDSPGRDSSSRRVKQTAPGASFGRARRRWSGASAPQRLFHTYTRVSFGVES